ncbi:MAG: AmmeMemoRadiSam system radical SAM enzyme [Acidobacteriota bacterium]
MKEAMFWEEMGNGKVRCELCRHRCVIYEGKIAVCGVRINKGGKLFSLVYGNPIAMHVDPIEKKPLFHFYPGTTSFSIATVGCNMKCSNCQNWDISQYKFDKQKNKVKNSWVTPEEIVKMTMEKKCKTISYTYTEPTIFFEWAYDISKLASEKKIYNIFVTNGYMSEIALKTISPYLHGANVDLKSFRENFYHKIPGAKLKGVLESIKLMKKYGIWVEITTLLIPTLNDSKEEIRDIARFIKEEIGPETPWHISRFYPNYKLLNLPPTELRSIRKARDIGVTEGLKFVYGGNVPGDEAENTYCPNCKTLLIERYGYTILKNRVSKGKCPECQEKIEGVGL